MADKLRVAVVGLRFGESFPAIYRDHPDVEAVGICDLDGELLARFGDAYGFAARHGTFEEVLRSGGYDAVHLVTPIPTHAEMAVAVLEAGMHCACTVPMATTLEDIARIQKAVRKSGKRYMMIETAAYTYQCLLARDMAARGEFGRIQFLRGAHYQDMERWPDYWMGLPPMHYATHAVAPLLCVADTYATKVHCFGSGRMREELVKRYGNPYPAETAIFTLAGDNLAAEVTRTLFHTAREYMESFNIYGEKCSLEWQMENEKLVQFTMDSANRDDSRGLPIETKRIDTPDFHNLLPPSITRHSGERVSLDPTNPHLSVLQGGGHHGSHPHMVHEFVRCILEDRPAYIDEVRGAEITAPGICAHLSAMENGAEVEVPCYR